MQSKVKARKMLDLENKVLLQNEHTQFSVFVFMCISHKCSTEEPKMAHTLGASVHSPDLKGPGARAALGSCSSWSPFGTGKELMPGGSCQLAQPCCVPRGDTRRGELSSHSPSREGQLPLLRNFIPKNRVEISPNQLNLSP